MKFDFSQVSDIEDFVSVPNGTYPCRIGEVRRREATDGTERWSLRWEIESGPFAGRTAAWDNLSWTEKGVRRVKMVLGRLGFPVEGEITVQQEDLLGRRALVSVHAQEYTDPNSGRRILSNRVPFTGVERMPEETAAPTPF